MTRVDVGDIGPLGQGPEKGSHRPTREAGSLGIWALVEVGVCDHWKPLQEPPSGTPAGDHNTYRGGFEKHAECSLPI